MKWLRWFDLEHTSSIVGLLLKFVGVGASVAAAVFVLRPDVRSTERVEFGIDRSLFEQTYRDAGVEPKSLEDLATLGRVPFLDPQDDPIDLAALRAGLQQLLIVEVTNYGGLQADDVEVVVDAPWIRIVGQSSFTLEPNECKLVVLAPAGLSHQAPEASRCGEIVKFGEQPTPFLAVALAGLDADVDVKWDRSLSFTKP